MAEIDIIRHKRGNRNSIPTLLDGQVHILEDEKRLVFGTVSGNIDVPNQKDLNDVQTASENAVSDANEALITSNQANTTANNALKEAYDTQAQVANIVANNGNPDKDSELVDSRTDASGTVFTTLGDHVRSLDNDYGILKGIQTYTATTNNTTVVPIPTIANLDLTQCNMDIFLQGCKLIINDNYTIDTINKNISLVGWSLNENEKLEYRIYR
jgi:hypothetical protein